MVRVAKELQKRDVCVCTLSDDRQYSGIAEEINNDFRPRGSFFIMAGERYRFIILASGTDAFYLLWFDPPKQT